MAVTAQAPRAGSGRSTVPEGKSLSPIPWPLWLFPLVALAALAWPLGPGRTWVGSDNIQSGVHAIHLLRDWNWHFFETFGQTPSTGSYLCFLFLKLGLSPFLAFTLPGFVASLGTVLLGSLAVRKAFSSRPAFFFGCLLGFNAWTLAISRNLILLPFWESSLLYVSSRFWAGGPGRSQRIEAALLGIVLGLGPFAFPSWVVMAPPIFLLVLHKTFGKGRRDLGSLLIFLATLALGLSPFLLAVSREGYGGHILKIAFWNRPSLGVQLGLAWDYLQGAIGWGHPASLAGTGFLNTFSRAFFLLGTVELVRSRKDPRIQWIALAFFLGWLPGFLSNTVEFNRVLLVLPFLVLVCALGAEALVAHFPFPQKKWCLALLLFLPYCDDLPMGFQPGTQRTSVSSIVDEEEICYHLLEPLSAREGPGWILAEFTPQPNDYSLNYYSYPFNAALNPALGDDRVRWCAIFTEEHFGPYLAKEFPEARWKHFQTPDSRTNSRHVLALIPLDGPNKVRLGPWKDFHQKIERIDFAILDLPNGRSRAGILGDLRNLYDSLPEEPFLRSFFFEKLAFNYSWERTFYPGDPIANWTVFGGIFKDCIAGGIQDADLYDKYGKLLVSEERWNEAQKAFRRALDLYPGNPWLIHELEAAKAHQPAQ